MNTADRVLLTTLSDLQPAGFDTICKQLQRDPTQMRHALGRLRSRGFIEQSNDGYRLAPGVLDILIYAGRSAACN